MDPIKLVGIRSAALDSDGAGSNELDLGPYVNAGKRQIIGVWAPAVTGTDTDETYDNKFQDCATTVGSDFADISGAAFTQVTQESTLAFQTVAFSTNKRYIRSYATLGGTTPTMQDWTGVILTGRFDT